jgi:hypothetical protein
VSPVSPAPVPAIDEPSRSRSAADPPPVTKATGHHGGPVPVPR